MSLHLGYEAAPNVQVFRRPPVGTAEEDVMRHDIVVAKRRHNRNDKVVDGPVMVMMPVAKNLCELGDHKFVLLYHLPLRARYVFIVVVSRRVARPDDEVDVVLDILVDPLERLVDERERRVAARRLGAIHARRPMSAMAGCVRRCARVGLVKRIGVEVWKRVSAVVRYEKRRDSNSPVM